MIEGVAPSIDELMDASRSPGPALVGLLDEVFGYVHAPSGVVARVTVGKGIAGGVRAEGVLFHDGLVVGDFVRTLASSDAGWVAQHVELDLDRDVQRRGFGSAYLAHLERWYRANGLVRIDLRADMEAGGYVWARLGFDWDLDKATTVDDIHLIASRLRWRAQRGPDPAARVVADALEDPDLLASGLIPTPRDVVALGTIGRDTLLGATWNEVKHLR